MSEETGMALAFTLAFIMLIVFMIAGKIKNK